MLPVNKHVWNGALSSFLLEVSLNLGTIRNLEIKKNMPLRFIIDVLFFTSGASVDSYAGHEKTNCWSSPRYHGIIRVCFREFCFFWTYFSSPLLLCSLTWSSSTYLTSTFFSAKRALTLEQKGHVVLLKTTTPSEEITDSTFEDTSEIT